MNRTLKSPREETVLMNSEAYGNAAASDDLVAKSPLEVRLYKPYTFVWFEQYSVIILGLHCMSSYICREAKILIGARHKICLKREIGEKWK